MVAWYLEIDVMHTWPNKAAVCVCILEGANSRDVGAQCRCCEEFKWTQGRCSVLQMLLCCIRVIESARSVAQQHRLCLALRHQCDRKDASKS